MTKPGATGIRTVEQNNGPGGTGNGLVPPVPFGSMVDELLSLAASARTRWVTERIASLSNGSRGKVRNQKTKSQVRVVPCQAHSSAVASSPKEKLGTETFLPVDTRLNGYNLGTSSNGRAIWGGDISSFQGQTRQLVLFGPGSLDFIQFSNQPIPEPSVFGLFARAGLKFHRKRCQRR